MKFSRRSMLAVAPVVALAGSALSAPVAGAQSVEMGSLSPEAIQGSIMGQSCALATTATKDGVEGNSYADVSSRTGVVEEKDKAYFRVDGWGGTGGQNSRIAFATEKPLKNVKITLKLDDKLKEVKAHDPQPELGIAVGKYSLTAEPKVGVDIREKVTEKIEGNTITLTIPEVPANGSLGYSYSSTTGAPGQGEKVVNAASLTGEGLAEAGFCEDTPGALGSVPSPDLGSLAIGGGLAIAAALAAGGGAWAVQNGLIQLPPELAAMLPAQQ